MSAVPYAYDVVDFGDGPRAYRHDYRWDGNSNKNLPAEERFWSKVHGSGATDCWVWLAGKDRVGYGLFSPRSRVSVRAHVWAYTNARGSVPAGFHLDHLCENTSCVNPWHLEAVTPRENARRRRVSRDAWLRTHCKSGHPLTGDNELIYTSKKDGSTRRYCRECNRLNSLNWRRSFRGVAA